MVMVVLFAGRSLSKNIEVSWKKEQTPQNAMQNKQFKLFNLRNIDYEYNIQVPKYWEAQFFSNEYTYYTSNKYVKHGLSSTHIIG